MRRVDLLLPSAVLLTALACTSRVDAQACKGGTRQVDSTCLPSPALRLDDSLTGLERRARDSFTVGVRQLFDTAEATWRAYRSLTCRSDFMFAGAFAPGSDSSRTECLVDVTRRRVGDVRTYIVARASGPPSSRERGAPGDGEPLDLTLVGRCLDGSAGATTQQEEGCLFEVFATLQPVRDSLIARVRFLLNPQARAALDTATAAWEAFARLDCRALGQAQDEGGSVANVETDMCFVFLRQRQVKDLRRLAAALDHPR